MAPRTCALLALFPLTLITLTGALISLHTPPRTSTIYSRHDGSVSSPDPTPTPTWPPAADMDFISPALRPLLKIAPPPRSPLPGTTTDLFNNWDAGVPNCCPLVPDYDRWLSDPHWYSMTQGGEVVDAVDQLRIFALPRAEDRAAEMLKLLAEMPHRGADLVYKAAQRCSPEATRALLAAGAKPHPDERLMEGVYGYGAAPLHEAAHRGCLECVRILVDEAGVHPDARGDRFGRTPLMHAVERGHDEVVGWLLGTGRVNPARIYWWGSTDALLIRRPHEVPLLNMTPEAMGRAGYGGNPEVVKMFLRWAGVPGIETQRDVPASTTWLTNHQLACIKAGLREAAMQHRSDALREFMPYLSRYYGGPLIAWDDLSSELIESTLGNMVSAARSDDVDIFQYLMREVFGPPEKAADDPWKLARRQQPHKGDWERLLKSVLEQVISWDSDKVFASLIQDFGVDISAVYGPDMAELRWLAQDPDAQGFRRAFGRDTVLFKPNSIIEPYLRCFVVCGKTAERCNEELARMLRDLDVGVGPGAREWSCADADEHHGQSRRPTLDELGEQSVGGRPTCPAACASIRDAERESQSVQAVAVSRADEVAVGGAAAVVIFVVGIVVLVLQKPQNRACWVV